MIAGRMCDARQATFGLQTFICFGPCRDGLLADNPMSVGGLVTPVGKFRHYLGMCSGPAKCLHRTLGLPYGQCPIGVMKVHKEPPAAKSRCSRDLALCSQSIPEKRQQKAYRSDAKAGNRGEHIL